MSNPVDVILEPLESDVQVDANHRKRKLENEDDDDFEEVDVTKEFRFNARTAWLTYPKCPIDPCDFLNCMDEKVRTEISMCFVKQECHADGSKHLHAYLSFCRKVNWSGARVFDLKQGEEQYHFHKGKTTKKRAVQAAWEYLCKDGIEPTVLVGKVDLFPSSVGYTNKKRDYETWLMDRRIAAGPKPSGGFPLIAPDGTEVPKPTPVRKRRHLWIFGGPTRWKSNWFMACIASKVPVFNVVDGQHGLDGYNGEQVIVWDDAPATIPMLQVLSNTYNYNFRIPCRYNNRMLYANSCRLLVVITNRKIDEYFNGAPDSQLESIHARFIEYDMDDETNQNFPRMEIIDD